MLFPQCQSKRHVCCSLRFISFIVNVKKKCDLKYASGMIPSKRESRL